MEAHRSQREAGFTLIELLVVCIIILLLLALLPSAFTAILSGYRTVKATNDCRRVGDAMMHWDLANGGAPVSTVTTPPPQGQITVSNFSPISTPLLTSLLVPNFISSVPVNDGWGHPYLYYLKNNLPTSPDTLMCISLGRDGGTNTSPLPTYTFDSFPTSDFDQDIVWADGSFVRYSI
jgi:prepilin-type N-terminal cleavage/methylation domain-containing protein